VEIVGIEPTSWRFPCGTYHQSKPVYPQ